MSLNELRARLGLGTPYSVGEPDIQVLTPAGVRGLRLPWLSRFSSATLLQHVEAYPGMALCVPQTGEYIIAEPWRNREDIANVIEVSARKDRAALIRALLDRFGSEGYKLVLLTSDVWQDQTKLYMEMGFARVESIIFFEMALKRGTTILTPTWAEPLPKLEYQPVDLSNLDTLLEIDHGSFPWLWWNSRVELEAYLQMSGVYAYIAYSQGEPIGYASLTLYRDWAHLDRLAVVTKYQGRKYGAAQLTNTLRFMLDKGAASVALSTQATNYQSHRLYKGYGFHQTSETMSFNGIVLQS